MTEVVAALVGRISMRASWLDQVSTTMQPRTVRWGSDDVKRAGRFLAAGLGGVVVADYFWGGGFFVSQSLPIRFSRCVGVVGQHLDPLVIAADDHQVVLRLQLEVGFQVERREGDVVSLDLLDRGRSEFLDLLFGDVEAEPTRR